MKKIKIPLAEKITLIFSVLCLFFIIFLLAIGLEGDRIKSIECQNKGGYHESFKGCFLLIK